MGPLPFEPNKVVVHPELEDQYDAWGSAAGKGEQPAQAIWNSFKTALWRIKNDGQWGEVIPKSDIPAYFQERYGVENLYCVDLASFHRCFYTIVHRDIVVLDLVDHDTYDQWF